MARVNVEERFFSDWRAKRLQRLMKTWTLKHTEMTLIYLWHASQEVLSVEGTAIDLCCWAEVEPHEEDQFINGLVEVGLVHKVGDKYVIHGNESQIETRVERIKSSSKGGEATRAKWLKIKKKAKKNEEKSASGPNGLPNGQPNGEPNGLPNGQPNGEPNGLPNGQPNGEPNGQPFARPNSMQGNSEQFNSNVCVSENSGNSTMNPDDASENHTHKMGNNLRQKRELAKVRADLVKPYFLNEKNYVSLDVLNAYVDKYAQGLSDEEWISFAKFLAVRRSNGRGGLPLALFGKYFKAWQQERNPKEAENRKPDNRRENIPKIAKELASGRNPLELVYDDSRGDFEASGAMTDFTGEDYGGGEVSQL